MKRLWILPLLLILIMLVSTSFYVLYANDVEVPHGFFFGVSCGSSNVGEAKLLIDKVKKYTNFLIVNNWDVTTNETALTEICNYAAESGLSFIVFFDYVILYSWHEEWIITAKDRWKEKFLGIYIYEEPGGKQIDTGLFDEFKHGSGSRMYENVTTYTEAADVFVEELPKGLSFSFLKNHNISTFVSDYALYWYDYLAGYDTVFAELGWNNSIAQHIALCRGAAKAQGKDWGAIITWTYEGPPYLANGTEILKQMISAYESGAKYVVVFDYPKFPEDNPFGVLNEEHFQAMQQFWAHVKRNSRDYGKTSGEVALVLPKDYGWGMRFLEDKIWGLWKADSLAPVIWENMNRLIEIYNLQLDIVYDDPRLNCDNYSEVYLWNNTQGK
jgi:hypothetical protein